MSNTHIIMIGRTGDGKSTFCNLVARSLGFTYAPFKEGNMSESQTSDPSSICRNNITIIDTPGLMDTSGLDKDAENIRKIVNFSKQLQYFNGIILVMNHEVPRFDAGMQDALKLNVDSFGKDLINHLGIVYTRCPEANGEEVEEIKERIRSILVSINRRCNTYITIIPYWIVECHPEEYAKRRVPQTEINKYISNTQQQVQAMLAWAKSKSRFSTMDAVFGEYEQEKARKIAENNARQERIRCATEEAERIAAQRRAREEYERYEEERRQKRAAQLRHEEAERRREEQRKERIRQEEYAAQQAREREAEAARIRELNSRPPVYQHHYESSGGGGLCVIM